MNYNDYLIENVAYSFEDDKDFDIEEKEDFNIKRISMAENILHSVGPEKGYPRTEMIDKYEFADAIEGEKFFMVLQSYLQSGYIHKYWDFPVNKDGSRCTIVTIKYIQSSLGREFLEFYINYHITAHKTDYYITLYDIKKKLFNQYMYYYQTSKIESGTKRLFDYKDPELEEAILEIIEMFR